jgi:hypothetical protein
VILSSKELPLAASSVSLLPTASIGLSFWCPFTWTIATSVGSKRLSKACLTNSPWTSSFSLQFMRPHSVQIFPKVCITP